MLFFLLFCQVSDQITSVKTVQLSDISFKQGFEVPAQVIAKWDSSVSAEIVAEVHSVLVEVGDYVEAGQPLVELDKRLATLKVAEAKASLAEAEANLKLAQLQKSRSDNLVKDAVISEDLHSQRVAEVASREAIVSMRNAQLDQAQYYAEKCSLKAPFSGFITLRQAQKGQLTQIGSTLIQIVHVDNPLVSIKLSEAQRETVSKDHRMSFVWNQKVEPVILEKVLPVLNSQSRTSEARLSFSRNAFQPGTQGVVRWESDYQVIPPWLLVKRNGVFGLLLAEGETAVFHPLPEAVEGRPARVDLDPETLIIEEGRLGLVDGAPIKIL